jgi:hypothetical protein
MSILFLFFGIMCPMMTISLCKNFGIKFKKFVILKMDFTHDLWIKMGEKGIPYPTCPFSSISHTKCHFLLFQSYLLRLSITFTKKIEDWNIYHQFFSTNVK